MVGWLAWLEKEGLLKNDNKIENEQRKAFEIMADQYKTDAARGAQAVGQMAGAGLNRRGLGDSPLGAGITAQSQNQSLQRALGELNQMRSQMESGIADRKWQQEMMEYQQQMQMLQELIGLIGVAGGAYLGAQGAPAMGTLAMSGYSPAGMGNRTSAPKFTELGQRLQNPGFSL